MTHKEKIKKMRENIDVLTLTATPIPRTLHMSLIGIRDMSVLEEAPMDRMPIQTYVMEFNDEMIREAIERELSRGGQVYYVYNRVEDIADVAGRVQKLVPGASVSLRYKRNAYAIRLDLPTRTRNWYNWDSPNRSASWMIIVFAFAMSSPVSMIVVDTSTSISPLIKSYMISSSSRSLICPCAKDTLAPGTSF